MDSEKAMDGGGDSARQHSYRPRPYVDARQNSLANYDEYVALREIERRNQHDLRSFLMHQIRARQTELRNHPSRQPALAEPAKPQALESVKQQNEREGKQEDRKMLNDRLRTQVLANKLVEKFQARDEKRRELQNLDSQQMKEY